MKRGATATKLHQIGSRGKFKPKLGCKNACSAVRIAKFGLFTTGTNMGFLSQPTN